MGLWSIDSSANKTHVYIFAFVHKYNVNCMYVQGVPLKSIHFWPYATRFGFWYFFFQTEFLGEKWCPFNKMLPNFHLLKAKVDFLDNSCHIEHSSVQKFSKILKHVEVQELLQEQLRNQPIAMWTLIAQKSKVF